MSEQDWIQNTAVPLDRLLSRRHHLDGITKRLALVDEPPVRRLNAWVRDEIRPSPLLPEGAGRTVPWFDPEGGGEDAQLLFLMQDPSEVAAGTGFVSTDNDDPSARNATLACESADLPGRLRVHWNVFPHWVNVVRQRQHVDPTRPPQSYSQATDAAVHFLGELLGHLLPRLQVIVLLGRHAQNGWDLYRRGGGQLPPGIGPPLRCPSTSPQAWNNLDKATGIRNSELTIQTLRTARERLT